VIFFILPAYNEEKNIGQLLDNINSLMNEMKCEFSVLIVNDGSQDKTREVVEAYYNKMLIELVEFTENKGPGEVFRTAFSRVLDNTREGDLIVTMESDNTSDLGIFPKMLEKIEEGNDVVLASCYAEEGNIINVAAHRTVLSWAANTLLKIFFNIKRVNTYSSFYRVYRSSALKKVHEEYKDSLIEHGGFVCVVELLIKLNKIGARITEVPMVLDPSLRKGKSGMNILKTIGGYLRLIIKEGFNGTRDILHQGEKNRE